VRMGYQNQSALAIARFLQSHPSVEMVNYPGLDTHPGHARASELFEGFGGMMSFEIRGGLEAAEQFIERVTLPICAPSLGGVEALITRPAATSHAGMAPEDRKALGISDSLIRLSVGLESTEEMIADFDQALS